MKNLLKYAAIAGGGLLLMSAAKGPKKEEQRLRDSIAGVANGWNDSEQSKFDFIQKLNRMSKAEIITLYTFLITHDGNLSFLTTQLRGDLNKLNEKYNLFS